MTTAADQLALVAKGFCGAEVPLVFVQELPRELLANNSVALPSTNCDSTLSLGYLAAQTAMYLDSDVVELNRARGLVRALLQTFELPRTFTALAESRPGAVSWLAEALKASSCGASGLQRVLESVAWLRFPEVARHVADRELVREFATIVGVSQYLRVRTLINEAVDAVDTFEAHAVVRQLAELLQELSQEDPSGGSSDQSSDELDEAMQEFDELQSNGGEEGTQPQGASDDRHPQCDGDGEEEAPDAEHSDGASTGAEGRGSDAASEPNANSSEQSSDTSAGVDSRGAGGEHGDQCAESSPAQSPSEQHEATEGGRLESLQEELQDLEHAVPLSVRLRDRVVDSTQAPLPATTTGYRVVENQWQICTQSSLSGLLARTGHLQDALREALRGKVRPPSGRDESGSRLRKGWTQHFCRGESRLFERRRRDESLDTAVCVLLDQSGSMARQARMVHAKEAVAALVLALSEIEDVDLYAGAFPARDPFALPGRQSTTAGVERLVEPALHQLKAIARVLTVEPEGNTPMHCAIEFAHDELRQSRRQHRVVIMITDGDADRPLLVKQRIDAEPEVKHILISIGDRAGGTAKHFDVAVEVPDVTTLPEALTRVVADVIGA